MSQREIPRPSPRAFDRLWPVLVGLGAMLIGAFALEVYAERAGATGRRVTIEAGPDPAVEDEDGDTGGGAAEITTAPLDDDHARARLLARRGLVDDAIRTYELLATRYPEAAPVHAELGYWRLATGAAKLALPALERATLLDPSDPRAVLNLGVAQARVGQLAAAETTYRRVIAMRAHYGAAQLALGVVLRHQGKLDEAIAVLTAAAAAGSNDARARALVGLGRAQLANHQRDAAAAAFRRAIEFAPAVIEIRLAVARGWLATGKRDDATHAAELLRQAAAMAPDVAPVQSALGRAREKLDDLAGAEAAYARAVQLDPDNRYARRRLLRLALDRQDYPQARAAAELLLTQDPDDPEHHFLAGLVAARDDKLDAARGHYRDAIARAADGYPEAYYNLAIVEKNAGHRDDAIAAYHKAIELRPTYQQAWNNLGLLLAETSRGDEAIAAFRRAIEIDAGYAAAWLNLGEHYGDLGRSDDAIAAFQQAIALRPGYREARLNLAVAFGRAGRHADAIATYRALVTDQPRYVAAWSNLGHALADAGDTTGAADAARHALAIDPDHLPSLRLLATSSDPDRAVAAWQEVVDHAPDDVAARVALAKARLATGDLAGCERDLRVVVTDDRAKPLLPRCSVN